MSEQKIRKLLDGVEAGKVSRRKFIDQMVGLGLTVPMASSLLFHAGLAQAQTASGYKPTKRGGGGPLKVLWWQGATLLNPHFAVGTKDQEGSRIFYEPLGAWSNDGDLIPILATEAPNRANGGVSADGKTITWKLKRISKSRRSIPIPCGSFTQRRNRSGQIRLCRHPA
jgi:peptide/nickel transport system substrate-binding protein